MDLRRQNKECGCDGCNPNDHVRDVGSTNTRQTTIMGSSNAKR
jgi:hypothetical protein